MVRKGLIVSIVAGLLAVNAFSADVYVRVAPPRPVIERRGPPPSRHHLWASGYHRWDGRTYVWMPGHWVERPRPRAHWVPAHWVHRPGGWLLVEGHWR